MNPIAKVAAVSTAALGLLIGGTPAHAYTNAAALVFAASALASRRVWAPGFGPPANGYYPFSGSGNGVSTTDGVGFANIALSGQYHTGIVNVFGHGAFCGLSGGSDGTGNVVFGGTVVDLVDVGWSQSAASAIVLTGDTLGPDSTGEKTGGLAGVAIVQGGVPCYTIGATIFTVLGAAVATW